MKTVCTESGDIHIAIRLAQEYTFDMNFLCLILTLIALRLIWLIPNWWVHKWATDGDDPRNWDYDGYRPPDAMPNFPGAVFKIFLSLMTIILVLRFLAPESSFAIISRMAM